MRPGEIIQNLLFVTAYSLFVSNVVARYNLVNRALSSLSLSLNNLSILLITIACSLVHGYLNKVIGNSVFTPPDAEESYYKSWCEVPRVISFIGLWLGILSLSNPMFNYLGKQMMFQNPRITTSCLAVSFIYPAMCIITSGINYYQSKGKPQDMLGAAYSVPQILAPYITECSFFSITK